MLACLRACVRASESVGSKLKASSLPLERLLAYRQALLKTRAEILEESARECRIGVEQAAQIVSANLVDLGRLVRHDGGRGTVAENQANLTKGLRTCGVSETQR